MKLRARTLTFLTITVLASFGLTVISPAAQPVRPAEQVLMEPSLSMLSDEAQASKWNQEARDFDGALKDLESILRLDIETKEGSEEATKVIDRNLKKLQLVDSKIASGAIRSGKLKKGIEDESRKRGGNEKFAEEFKKNPATAKEIEGLQEAARDAEAAIEPAREVLRKLGDKFEAAAKKKQSANLFTNSFTNVAYLETTIGQRACGDGIVGEAVFQNPCQLLGINVARNVCDVIYNIILLYVRAGRSALCAAGCIQRAASTWITCIAGAIYQPFPISAAARAACAVNLTTRTTACFSGC